MQQPPLFPSENPYTAPGVPPQGYGSPQGYGQPPDGAGAPAGFGIRAGARIIDTFVGGGLGAAIGVVLALTGLVHPHVLHAGGNPNEVMMRAFAESFSPAKLVFMFAGPIAYHTLAESISGATLGKLACGLRVRSENGGPASVGATFVRSLLYFIDSFCCGLVAYFVMQKSPQQQRLGDQVGKTVVVTKPMAGAAPVNMIGIVVGLAAWAVCVVVGRLI